MFEFLVIVCCSASNGKVKFHLCCATVPKVMKETQTLSHWESSSCDLHPLGQRGKLTLPWSTGSFFLHPSPCQCQTKEAAWLSPHLPPRQGSNQCPQSWRSLWGLLIQLQRAAHGLQVCESSRGMSRWEHLCLQSSTVTGGVECLIPSVCLERLSGREGLCPSVGLSLRASAGASEHICMCRCLCVCQLCVGVHEDD